MCMVRGCEGRFAHQTQLMVVFKGLPQEITLKVLYADNLEGNRGVQSIQYCNGTIAPNAIMTQQKQTLPEAKNLSSIGNSGASCKCMSEKALAGVSDSEQ